MVTPRGIHGRMTNIVVSDGTTASSKIRPANHRRSPYSVHVVLTMYSKNMARDIEFISSRTDRQYFVPATFGSVA